MVLPQKKIMSYKGVRFVAYSAGWLSISLNRTQRAIRMWEDRGFLPLPIFYTKPGETRWYCAAEILSYKSAYHQAGMKNGLDIASTGFPLLCQQHKAHLKQQLVLSNLDFLCMRLPEKELDEAYLKKNRRVIKRYRTKRELVL